MKGGNMSIRKRESKKHPRGVYEVYLYYSDEGVKRRYSESGYLTLQEAKKREVELIAELAKKGRLKRVKPVTFKRVYEEFLERDSSQYSIGTIKITKTSCKHFFQYLDKNKKSNILIKNIDYGLLRDFFNEYQGNTKQWFGRLKSALNRVFKYALRAGYVDSNPLELITTKGKESLTNANTFIPESIFNSLIKELMSHNDFIDHAAAVACLISYYTGFRESEVLALTKEDIDYDNNMIRLNKKIEYRDSAKELYITETLKTQKSYANQPMPKPLKKVLLKWQEVNPNELLICTFEGRLINPSNLMYHCKRAAKKIGFDDFTFHSLRHTFITNLVMNQVDIKTVQELARHKNVSVTLDVYTHLMKESKREAVDKVFSNNVETAGTLQSGSLKKVKTCL